VLLKPWGAKIAFSLEVDVDLSAPRAAVSGKEHWTHKEGVKLFLWQKAQVPGAPKLGTVLFVHGSSMASQPTFDLKVRGRPDS
jgi:hypothetical protein